VPAGAHVPAPTARRGSRRRARPRTRLRTPCRSRLVLAARRGPSSPPFASRSGRPSRSSSPPVAAPSAPPVAVLPLPCPLLPVHLHSSICRGFDLHQQLCVTVVLCCITLGDMFSSASLLLVLCSGFSTCPSQLQCHTSMQLLSISL
jgi:hypothetical protein